MIEQRGQDRRSRVLSERKTSLTVCDDEAEHRDHSCMLVTFLRHAHDAYMTLEAIANNGHPGSKHHERKYLTPGGVIVITCMPVISRYGMRIAEILTSHAGHIREIAPKETAPKGIASDKSMS